MVIMGERAKTIEYRFCEVRAPKARSISNEHASEKCDYATAMGTSLENRCNKLNLIFLLGGISKWS